MSRAVRDFRGTGKPVGAVVTGLGVTLGLCAGIGFLLEQFYPSDADGLSGAWSLATAAAVTVLFGIALFVGGRRYASDVLTRREAVLSVALIWLAAGAFGALPFVLGTSMTPIEAFFESISGLTTTGATVVTDIQGTLSKPLLLWRSLLQWLGGMGIVVLFVAVFPNVGAGGKHMFRGEVPGTTAEGFKPRIAETSFTLWKIYVAFTVLEAGILVSLQVDPFMAVCHALTTMSTGGFSPFDSSIAGFENPVVEYVISAFMLIAAVNFGLYYAALRGRKPSVIVRSVEFRAFVAIVVASTALLTYVNVSLHGSLEQSFRYSLFQVSTFVSSTGYTTDDYMLYPPVGLAVIVFLMFVGGSSGSTAGGIKIERLVLMTKQSWSEIHQSFRPSVVRVVRMGRQVVDSSVLADVAAFFVVYMGTLTAGVLVIAALEQTALPTTFGAVLSCLSNMGPAPFHVGSDNFASYSPVSKIVFTIIMLFGRLEFFTLFALMVPGFWKR